jgi:hypothetical protein
MGDPVTMMLIGGTVLSAFGQVQAGNAQAQAAEYERAQYEEQKKVAEIQAVDEELDRRRRLERVLASNRAAAAASGIGTDTSRSFLAIQEGNEDEASRDIGRIRLNAAGQTSRYSIASDQARLEGKSARKSGMISAGATLLGGGYKAYNSGS